MTYPVVKIQYEELDSFPLKYDEPFVLAVHWNGVPFEFLIRLRQTQHLIVLGSGAMEKPEPLPYFQRHSWMNEFEDSVIYYNDPTLYLADLPVGWGQGTIDRFYLEDIATLLDKLIAKANISRDHVLFYGSSAGGFMGLMLAGYLRGSTALVNSPQTSLTKWLDVPVRNVFRVSYPGYTFRQASVLHGERINVMKFYKKIKYVPKIYYLQNAACELDMSDHLIPFLSELAFMEPGSTVNPVIVDLYYDPQPGPASFPRIGGHGAVGKLETIDYIRRVRP
ncbi:glycosyl transferase family 2 [Alicyclobacillus cycloheptanicus]|nr:glycosyl transferase family 2 [Alicyclobacillus cycloheptanicus]